MNTPPHRFMPALGAFLLVACGSDSTAPGRPLTVSAVSPASGLVVGGTSVTITGTNFIDVTGVTIGGAELADQMVVSATQITGTTPVGASFGPADLIVTTSGHGSGRCSGCFSYDPLGIQAQPITAGLSHTCAFTSSGAAYCWGANYSGELGGGSRTGSSVPVAVTGGLTFRVLSADGEEQTAGLAFTCGVTSSGAAYCWGNNDRGQLGNGDNTGPEQCAPLSGACSTTPVAVAGGLSFSTVSAGLLHTCGLTSAGAAYCWGDYNGGTLGTAPPANPGVPGAVSGGLSFSALATGGHHTCGLTGAGMAYCWGVNTLGQLGVGTTTGPETCFSQGSFPCSRVPVPVATALRWASITAGHGHTCALTPGGAAYCWGRNYEGQLGDGTLGNALTPVAVAGGTKFSALFARLSYTCGLTESGAAYCWGNNDRGQLGDGSTTFSTTPVGVAGGLTFSFLAAGFYHTCGLTTSGAAYCWGYNFNGQLGDGSTNDGPTPVAVSGWPPQ